MLGSGTELDPYQVATASDLNDVRNDLTAYYIQVADIDLSVYANWIPTGTKLNPFIGGYNGNNFTISNLTITMDYATNNFSIISNVGLFGNVHSINYIKNIKLTDINIAVQENNSVGSGTGYTGTLIGYTATCHNISNCYVSGNVSLIDGDYFGGLIGGVEPSDDGEIVNVLNCDTNINLNANYFYSCGGLIAYAYGDSLVEPVNLKIENCESNITTTSTYEQWSFYLGGFIADATKLVVNKCSSVINMVGASSTDDIGDLGGFIGAIDRCVINNCYSRGLIAGYSEIGGFIGDSYGDNVITNCYSACIVDGCAGMGGFIGYVTPDDVINSCYYDSEVSGQSDNDGRGVPKTTAEMKTQSTFVDWDFVNIWVINLLINDGYPCFGTGISTSNISANVSGTWYSTTPYINVNGIWKQLSTNCNINNIWK